MKTLFLCRHAKSSWNHPDLTDRDRPLNERGKRDAPEMGRRLAARGACVDLLVSSPARRARETAAIIADAIGYARDAVVIDERIYDAAVPALIAVVRDLDDASNRVLLVGHNPGLTDLVNQITPHRLDNLPTCGIVELAFDSESWSNAGRVEAELITLDYPKKTAL